MKRLVVLSFLVSLVVSSLAETGVPHTPAQLHEMSTVVFKGTVMGTVMSTKDNKTFPMRALVSEVVKGALGKSGRVNQIIYFKHKDPAKFVILEEEFNTPEIKQKGTFYFQDQDGAPVLIGYIKDAGKRKD